MKKTLSCFSAFIIGLFIIANVQAAEDVQNDQTDGGTVTITTTVSDGPDVIFDPSTNVIISGGSDQTAFLIAGYHSQVDFKKAGKQFAMASDTNIMFWRDISDSDDRVDIETFTSTETNSTAMDADWFTM